MIIANFVDQWSDSGSWLKGVFKNALVRERLPFSYEKRTSL